MKQLIVALVVVAIAAVWTFIDRRFPSSRVPGIYREKLWQNILVNLALVTIIYVVVFYLLL